MKIFGSIDPMVSGENIFFFNVQPIRSYQFLCCLDKMRNPFGGSSTYDSCKVSVILVQYFLRTLN